MPVPLARILAALMAKGIAFADTHAPQHDA